MLRERKHYQIDTEKKEIINAARVSRAFAKHANRHFRKRNSNRLVVLPKALDIHLNPNTPKTEQNSTCADVGGEK